MDEPRIEILDRKFLIGMRAKMSLLDDGTAQLWSRFMPRSGEVEMKVDAKLYSMQRYPTLGSFANFLPTTEFEKWAAVEVSSLYSIPEGMESYVLEGGDYAVFHHRGPASAAPAVFGYIFGEWIPSSAYDVDAREHFEVLQAGYRPEDEHAEEDIWIPIKQR